MGRSGIECFSVDVTDRNDKDRNDRFFFEILRYIICEAWLMRIVMGVTGLFKLRNKQIRGMHVGNRLVTFHELRQWFYTERKFVCRVDTEEMFKIQDVAFGLWGSLKVK